MTNEHGRESTPTYAGPAAGTGARAGETPARTALGARAGDLFLSASAVRALRRGLPGARREQSLLRVGADRPRVDSLLEVRRVTLA